MARQYTRKENRRGNRVWWHISGSDSSPWDWQSGVYGSGAHDIGQILDVDAFLWCIKVVYVWEEDAISNECAHTIYSGVENNSNVQQHAHNGYQSRWCTWDWYLAILIYYYKL